MHTNSSEGYVQPVDKRLQQAITLHKAGRFEEARQKYQDILKIEPKNYLAIQYLGVVSRRLGRPRRAIELIRHSLKINSQDIGGYNNLALAYLDVGEPGNAVNALKQGLELDPDRAGLWAQLAVAYSHKKEHENAIEAARTAIKCDAQHWSAYLTLGGALHFTGRLEEAEDVYSKLLAQRPDDAKGHQNLGALLKAQGKMREAEQSYRKALELEPRMSGAWRAIAEMKTFRTFDTDVESMINIYNDSENDSDIRKNIAFALGKAHEDLGDYQSAFSYYQQGNHIHREKSKFDVRRHVSDLKNTRRVFETRRLREVNGYGYRDPTPIFILGMPRSGTTLTEQILASHQDIEGGGERYDLSKIVGRAPEIAGVTGRLVDWIDKIDADGLNKLGQAYIDALRHEYPEAPHVTDKMPGNFRFVGLIHAILPEAKIIHTRRHPADTCLSCYTKLFTDSQDFTYDLSDLGRYYRAYEELMAHWRAVLPQGAMLEVEYERVVADVEGQTRRILDFVGLPWDENCLRFFENKRGVATASQTQVRQPIYKTSVQRWRNYRSQLQPLFRAMASGYEESGPE